MKIYRKMKNNKNDWEKEFNNLWEDLDNHVGGYYTQKERILNFIRNVRKQAILETLKEVDKKMHIIRYKKKDLVEGTTICSDKDMQDYSDRISDARA